MATAPFHVSPELTAIAIAYRNPVTDYIADLVMPRTRPVGKLEFSYTVYDLSAFNRPNTFVGRKGRPNEVTMSSTTQTAAIEDFGLDDLIPMSDIEQGRAIGRDIQAESVEYIMGLVKLDRECRVAAAAQNAANFTNTATLSGSNQWSHADSKPLTALLEYLDTPMMRPNTMILSAPVWSKLRIHPQIVKAIYPISAEGAVTRQQLAALLELKNIHIGASYVNSAKKGQDASLTRVWGNHCTLLYLDPTAETSKGVTWGMTVPYGTAVAGTIDEQGVGLRGGVRVRAGESLKELVVSKGAGMLLKNCIA